MPISRSLYDVIGVRPMATQAEIESSYIELVEESSEFPPTSKLGELLFKDVKGAYEILRDPEKRREYDELRNSEESRQMQQVTEPPPVSEPNGYLSYATWIIAAIVVVLIYSKITSPTPTVDFYKVHMGAQQSSRVEIEREELRRARYGETPLSKDEIAEISDKHVLNEIRKGKQ